jgi:hypothetical protein
MQGDECPGKTTQWEWEGMAWKEGCIARVIKKSEWGGHNGGERRTMVGRRRQDMGPGF